jgi:hypothetical protein
MHPTIAEFVRRDSGRSSLDGMPEVQPVVDPRITFNTVCSKSAKILALVAMVIGGGPEVNPAAPTLA